MFDTLQRFNVAIGAALCMGCWLVAYLLDVPEGGPRFVAVLVGIVLFCLCAFAWKPSKSLNDKAGR